jgi:uncharacterized protein (DUF1800 family)
MRLAPEEWLAPYVPSAVDPFDRRKAAHLLRRAGFGASLPEVDQAVRDGVERSLERLLRPAEDGTARFEALLDQLDGELLDLSKEEDLQAWWIYRIHHSPDPLREKLTLFWHGHFATSVRKVERPALMLRQNETLRQKGMGPFRDLLLAVSRDPAMLIWLDNRNNRKGKPYENYAREVMELFTLGVGNYSETDIKEVARAFTGWHLRNDQFFFDPAQHDAGEKTVLGQRGRLGGDEVIDILLRQPACARHLAGKLYRFFVAPTPPEGVLELLAARLRDSGYQLDTFLGLLLRSRVFFAASAWRARIKSPTEYVLGIIKALELRSDCRTVARALGNLGQTLFAPPTVKGWDGERAWVSAQWIVARANTAMNATALRGGRHESRFAPKSLLERAQSKAAPEDLVQLVADLLLDGDLPAAARPDLLHYMTHQDGNKEVKWNSKDEGMVDNKLRGLCHLVMALSEFQLA